MNRYFKLVHFEFTRFSKIYWVLMGIAALMQIVGVIVQSRLYLHNANEIIYGENIPLEQFLQDYGMMSFYDIADSFWMTGSIAIVAVSLLIYMLFIWYRDWLGKNTFIYRLFMLPTERITVFTAKATTIFLLVMGMVAFQIVLLLLESQILKWVVPDEFLLNMSVREILSFDYLNIIYPYSFSRFLIHYGLGLLVVVVAFTMILFERSFRLKGILFAILYGAGAVIVFTLPLLLQFLVLDGYLYPGELMIAEIITALIVLIDSIWTSHFLLKKKIRV